MTGWKHGAPYSLPIKPSPNLPNDQSIRLYASLCPFEATRVSVGRGSLVNYFTFLAREVREYLAEIGVEKLDDIIGLSLIHIWSSME